VMLGDVMVDGVKGQGAGDLWWNASEEIEVSVNAIILFPELREERSEYMGEVVLFPGAHLRNPIYQRQPSYSSLL